MRNHSWQSTMGITAATWIVCALVLAACTDDPTSVEPPPRVQLSTALSGVGVIVFEDRENFGSDLIAIGVDGTGRTNLTMFESFGEYNPSFSHDGARIAFDADRDGNQEIYVMAADGSGVQRVTTNGFFDYDGRPTWSPDGTQLAFEARRGFPAPIRIYLANVDGTGERAVSAGPRDEYPSWSPDGRTIAFTRDLAIWSVDVVTGTERQLTTDGFDRQPEFSPDGSLIAFVRYGVLAVMRADGSDVRIVPAGGLDAPEFFGESPAWSPDCTQLVFHDRSRIQIVDIATRALSLVVTSDRTEPGPVWQPVPGTPVSCVLPGAPSTPTPSADLSVAIVDDVDPVQPNGTVTYTVTVANHGPDPAALAGFSLSAEGGSPAPSNLTGSGAGLVACTAVPGAHACTWSDLPAGASRTATFTAQAPATGAIAYRVTTVIGTATDPNVDNDEATATTTVAIAAASGEHALANVAGGGSLTTDTEGDGATAADPIETHVTTPNAGSVAIDEDELENTSHPPYSLLGHSVSIAAPTASVASPLVLAFTIHSSLLGGAPAASLKVFRNGTSVPVCSSAAVTALPDPCVASITTVGDNVIIVVYTTVAGVWTFGLPIIESGDIRGAGIVVQSDGVTVRGTLNVNGFHAAIFFALDIASDTKSAWFAGVGRDGREFLAYVEDNGHPSNDVLRLWIAGVLVADGVRNNIQIRR